MITKEMMSVETQNETYKQLKSLVSKMDNDEYNAHLADGWVDKTNRKPENLRDVLLRVVDVQEVRNNVKIKLHSLSLDRTFLYVGVKSNTNVFRSNLVKNEVFTAHILNTGGEMYHAKTLRSGRIMYKRSGIEKIARLQIEKTRN